MDQKTREFIYALVLLIIGVLIILHNVDYFLLEDTLIYTIVNVIHHIIGVIFILVAFKVLSKNLEK